jgi:hypothetical protein
MKIAPRSASSHASDRPAPARSLRLVATATIVLLAACAGANQSRSALMPYATRGGSGVVEVTRNDLSAASTGSSLYGAIWYLRPRLLEPRRDMSGRPSSFIPTVYVNGVRVGSLESLEAIRTDRVRRVEFLPADDRRPYGYRYEPGAILVTLITDRP